MSPTAAASDGLKQPCASRSTKQAWLAEEARSVMIEPETAATAMASLVSTRAVVNETLRLFPSVFTIVRETIKRDRAAGIDLPPRSVIMIAPWVLHRHHKLWDDPAVFRPARFMPDQPPPARFSFMPFGAGPRICVGAQFAMTEAVLVLAALIGHFRVDRADERPVRHGHGVHLIGGHAGRRQRLPQHRQDVLNMRPAGNLRHHPAVLGMQLNLRSDRIGAHVLHAGSVAGFCRTLLRHR